MVRSFLSKFAARVVSSAVLAAVVLLGASSEARAQLANLKVVTDANPDYSDMESMVRSTTHNWDTDKEKMWAQFYWDHIARRQTNPIMRHGMALTDPIRQYNDYGYMMCSTISGAKCSTWNYMGYPNKYYDIGLHTVPDVWYDGAYHHYDNSLSVIYTLCDGQTIAGIEDVGATRGCAASGGKEEPGHVAIYHALNGTSADGFLEGSDTMRDLRHLGEDCFSPAVLKYRWYFYDQDRGHRYILNLRDGEVYTRHYSRQDKEQAAASRDGKYQADPDYFIPNGTDKNGKPIDPESVNPRYHLRGNGIRTWKPPLDDAHLAGVLYRASNVKASSPSGLEAAAAGQPAEAVFKVQGANVITSLSADAEFENAAGVTLSLSTDNGLNWKQVWKGDGSSNKAALKLRDEVNGQYDALVKVTIPSQSASAGATLKDIEFTTITALNAKTQPQLRLGKNTVYVGAGEQTESIVVWPDLQAGRYKPHVVEEKNLGNVKEHISYQGAIYQETEGEEAYVVFKVDAPTDMTSVTYGGRLYNRAPKSRIDFEHSFDGGKTWTKSYTLDDTKAPWDVIHYETVTDIPDGTDSVLFKYTMNGSGGGTSACSIYAVRMEVNHALEAPTEGPVEVTFDWSERQDDYSLVQRSHTQVVDKLPATYDINVGGADHPIVNALTVNLQGARGDVKPGYSDDKEAGGEKFVGKWATYGENLLVGKPYTVSIPSGTNWDAGDPQGKKLTDGRVGSSYNGGTSYREGLIWSNNQKPEIVVDMGENKDIAAFRIHLHGYDYADPIKGQVKDKVQVLTSTDGSNYTSHGQFDLNFFWKDVPVNYMWTDEETFYAHNHTKVLDAPVAARYVKYVLDCTRFVVVTEVQALDRVKFEPFDLKVALPDPASHGKAPPNATISPNPRKFAESELPDDIGKPREQ